MPPQEEADIPDDIPQPEPSEPPPEPPAAAAPAPDQGDTVADADAPGQPEPPESRPEPRRLSRGEREAYERARRRFAACGRCGYFIADCLLYLGEETLQAALLDTRDGWLRLAGDGTLRKLLGNAYGVRLDLDYDHLDGTCPECRRRFIFTESADGRTLVNIRA